MAQEDDSQQTATMLKSAATFGLWGVVAGTSGMNGRSLFLFTPPIGALLGGKITGVGSLFLKHCGHECRARPRFAVRDSSDLVDYLSR